MNCLLCKFHDAKTGCPVKDDTPGAELLFCHKYEWSKAWDDEPGPCNDRVKSGNVPDIGIKPYKGEEENE